MVRRSKATHANLNILFEPNEIQMEITDNSTGFVVPNSPTEFASNGRFGLLGVQERADLIGAQLEIESGLGKGARLKVQL